MIDDQTLLRVSLVCVITGLGIAYIASILGQVPVLSPGNVSTTHLGNTVRVTGEIQDVHRADTHLFFTVVQGGERLRAAWFNTGQSLPRGSSAAVKGAIRMYEGELELVVDTVTLKNDAGSQR